MDLNRLMAEFTDKANAAHETLKKVELGGPNHPGRGAPSFVGRGESIQHGGATTHTKRKINNDDLERISAPSKSKRIHGLKSFSKEPQKAKQSSVEIEEKLSDAVAEAIVEANLVKDGDKKRKRSKSTSFKKNLIGYSRPSSRFPLNLQSLDLSKRAFIFAREKLRQTQRHKAFVRSCLSRYKAFEWSKIFCGKEW